jgi:hypothetical protein
MSQTISDFLTSGTATFVILVLMLLGVTLITFVALANTSDTSNRADDTIGCQLVAMYIAGWLLALFFIFFLNLSHQPSQNNYYGNYSRLDLSKLDPSIVSSGMTLGCIFLAISCLIVFLWFAIPNLMLPILVLGVTTSSILLIYILSISTPETKLILVPPTFLFTIGFLVSFAIITAIRDPNSYR